MPAVTDPNTLSEVALFRGLTPAQLAELNELLRRKTFPAGATFITAEQPGEAVYVIIDGAVKVYLEDADGVYVILAILVAGEVVGEMSLLDCDCRSANVITLEETTVFWMDHTSFRECLQAMPAFQQNLLYLLCRRLRLANARIRSLALHDVEERVAAQLLTFAELYGRATASGELLIPFRLTQTDLAGVIGATRERVNRVITSYKQRRYISVDEHRRIIVLNPEALRRRLCGERRRPEAQKAA